MLRRLLQSVKEAGRVECLTCLDTRLDPKGHGRIDNVGEARETVYLVGQVPCPDCAEGSDG